MIARPRRNSQRGSSQDPTEVEASGRGSGANGRSRGSPAEGLTVVVNRRQIFRRRQTEVGCDRC